MILVRHSESAPRPDRHAHEWRLSRRGHRLAQRLAVDLAKLQPDAVFTSYEPKAVETGAAICRGLDLRMHQLKELGEHDRTNVPFLTANEFKRSVEHCLAHPDERSFGRETANEALGRFSLGIERVQEDRQSARPLVVTHGTVMSLYIARVSAVDPWRIWQDLTMPSYVDLQAIVPGEYPRVVRANEE